MPSQKRSGVPHQPERRSPLPIAARSISLCFSEVFGGVSVVVHWPMKPCKRTAMVSGSDDALRAAGFLRVREIKAFRML